MTYIARTRQWLDRSRSTVIPQLSRAQNLQPRRHNSKDTARVRRRARATAKALPRLPTRCLLSLQPAALAGGIQPETGRIPPLPLAAVQHAINTDPSLQLANNSMSHSYWGRTAGDRERDGGGAASSATCLRR